MNISPKLVYHNLRLLEKVSVELSAFYRQMAQEILADSEVDLLMRQAIAHRLEEANHFLELKTVTENDSY